MITSRQKINKDIKHLNNAPLTWLDICTYGIEAPPTDGHVRSPNYEIIENKRHCRWDHAEAFQMGKLSQITGVGPMSPKVPIRRSQSRAGDVKKRDLKMPHRWLWGWKNRTQAKEYGLSLEAGKVRAQTLPHSLQRNAAPPAHFGLPTSVTVRQ